VLTQPLILLDTNVVLYFLGGRLVNSLPVGQYLVSVITETAQSINATLFTNDVRLANLTEINAQSVQIM
jgi:rRNA-processing protein FCF1